MNDGNVQLLDQFGKPLSASDTAHFAASRVARELRDWTPSLESADSELSGEASTIAARSYDLERNNGIAGGAIRTNVDNIVGTGLRLAAKPDYRALGKSKQWADEWARNTEAKWRTFSGSKRSRYMVATNGAAAPLALPYQPGSPLGANLGNRLSGGCFLQVPLSTDTSPPHNPKCLHPRHPLC